MPFTVNVKPKGSKADHPTTTIEVGDTGDVQSQKQAEEHVAKVCPKLEVVPTTAE